ncbi:MAG TPA: Asp-tRNA(Asn)/Glu-tRNA(Gln) amidotransferase subunit GatC [Polyangiaceae bacterium]|nr:Asp-tRNA(Asn)/Glu-tRNA(Gln) amidotransferase subunit GatC [Polyangiaceae bacterium]
MAISREDVLHVAKLARLDLTEAEVTRMVKDLGSILEHVAELSQVDTSSVTPTAYVAVTAAPFRPDAVEPGVPRDVALAEAARHADGGFAVPAFVDDG